MTLSLLTIKHRAASERGRTLSAKDRDERNRLIDHLYEVQHLSLDRIGAHVGLSRERVRQLRLARGKNRRRPNDERELFDAWMAIVRDPGVTSARLARGSARALSLGHKLDAVRMQFDGPSDDAVERVCRWRRRHELALELAGVGALLGRTPSTEDIARAHYDSHDSAHAVASPATYQKVFGSIAKAQARAGFTPNPRGRRKR